MMTKNEGFKALLVKNSDIKTLVIGEDDGREFRPLVWVPLTTDGSPFGFSGEGGILSSGIPNAARILNSDSEVLFDNITVGTDGGEEWRAQMWTWTIAREHGEDYPRPVRSPMPDIVLERPYVFVGEVLTITNMMVKPL
jgi:hypothetical protein